MLNETESGERRDPTRDGLARELARMNLTVNVYTQWYWKTDLHNLLHFLSLRADPHAQYEIRVYADAMAEALRRWVPMVHEAFLDYRMGRRCCRPKCWRWCAACLRVRPWARPKAGSAPANGGN